MGVGLGLQLRVMWLQLCIVSSRPCGDQVLETCDKNKDGVIDYDEFVDMMTTHCLINNDAVVPDAPAGPSSQKKAKSGTAATKKTTINQPTIHKAEVLPAF